MPYAATVALSMLLWAATGYGQSRGQDLDTHQTLRAIALPILTFKQWTSVGVQILCGCAFLREQQLADQLGKSHLGTLNRLEQKYGSREAAWNRIKEAYGY